MTSILEVCYQSVNASSVSIRLECDITLCASNESPLKAPGVKVLLEQLSSAIRNLKTNS